MPKGSVPRNATANETVKLRRLREVQNERAKTVPKKMRPSAKEESAAVKSYVDATKYPSLYRTRKDADPSKQWYGKRADAKWKNQFREGLHDMATGMYSEERRTARDIRSKGSVKRIGKIIKAPVGKGGK